MMPFYLNYNLEIGIIITTRYPNIKDILNDGGNDARNIVLLIKVRHVFF